MAGKDIEEGEGIPLEKSSSETPRPTVCNRVKTGVLKNFLPICLVFFVVLGIVAPQPGVFFSELPTQYICVIGLFLHSGLKLKTGEVKDALKSYKAFIWGVICIMCLTPIIGGHLTGLLPYQPYATKDLEPQDNGVFSNGNHTRNGTSSPPTTVEGISILGPALFQIGIQIYFIVPCTIAGGVILTAQAGGAVALSVMLTVFCNLAAVFTVPPLVAWIIAFEDVKLDAIALLVKLVLTVLLPLLVGKGLRFVPYVKPCVKRFSNTLKMISIVLLTMIPWMKVSQASAENAFTEISVASIFAVLGWGLAMHVLFIFVIYPPCLILKLEKPSLKSVMIMASQKSLAVAVTVSGFLPFTQAEQGLISLPLIIIHLGIMVVDSVWATCWFARDAKKEKSGAAVNMSNGDAIMLENQSTDENELEPLADHEATV